MSDMTPTPEDLARDPLADLEVCEKATPGPWRGEWKGAAKRYGEVDGVEQFGLARVWGQENLEAVAIARTALPAYIRRAHAAETRLAEIREAVAALRRHGEAEDWDATEADWATIERLTRTESPTT